MFYRGKHFINIDGVNRKDFIRVFEEAEKMEMLMKDAKKMEVLGHLLHDHSCRPKKMYALIDKSTRTDVTFETAWENLGGRYSLKSAEASSMSKGESARMTALVLAQTSAGILVRHDKDPFFAQEMADAVEDYRLPARVLSAGCGNRQHPSQALIDLFPFYRLRGRDFLEGRLTFAIVGDLSNSRTIHSFLIGLANVYADIQPDILHPLTREKIKVFILGPRSEHLPDWLMQYLAGSNLELERVRHILDVASIIDGFYFTRWQKNLRNADETTANRQEQNYANRFGVTKELRKKMHKHAIAVHPLPHGLEYPPKLDLMDDRFVHLRQVVWAVPLRMALLRLLFAPDHELVRIQEECMPMAPPIDLARIEIPTNEILGQCFGCDNVVIAGYGRMARLAPGEKEKMPVSPPNQLCANCQLRLTAEHISSQKKP